ncbi:PREDICTED: prolyl 3-hydroxylase OGFOD1 [Cyphomyrmex costatus]|uniref:uS12 prolyl 3-hydroxylase n=1 Tax=Cyphomyrmex costatus TaxID=456900 RepID=A0A195CTT2_9HYME|nr:PREDICTED: prolyl 3-hydroxylase OGFOD1 [Cyphomyrmex costatus]KYN04103.1 2-oxoglutarate and iron-dependent oxygenase domain-containing protein 1 [Cyphomyrmex costatus]
MADQKLFSEHIYSTKFQEEFKKHWHSHRDFMDANLEIISKPFKVCRISNFLRDKKILENLKSELKRHDHTRKVLDLYQFEKTEDLLYSTDKYIRMLSRSFQKDLRSWMSRNTNIELNEKILMSSACYRNTDRLLCHDDNMIDRRIAYILYLTDDWSEEDGGALDLFDVDEEGLPRKVVKSLIPEYNSLVFFEVVENSYHQVAEVLAHDKCRWSINGWFHGPLKKDFHKPPRREPAKTFLEPSPTEVNLHSSISSDYLEPNIIEQIQEDVEMTSYTFLKNFLKESVYQQIANDLTSQDINWRMIGPADIRHYEIADEQTLPKPLKDICDLFKSISFFQLLKKYTGLDLVPEKTKKPKMTLELQRWSSGCYTLLYDKSLLKDTSDDLTQALISDFSTSEVNPDTNKTRQELKRGRIDDLPSPGNSSDKRKIARYLDSQSDVGTHSSKHEHSVDVDETSSSSDEKLSRSDTLANDSEDDCASENGEFLLDVIIQFHTQDVKGTLKTEETMDFVDPGAEEGIMIEIPMQDNHLCLVYRSAMVCRLQKYLNHFYDGYSYTFICTYHE